MAHASPASPAPKRAKTASTIRNVVSIEPRPYKYTYRKCQNMTIGCFAGKRRFFFEYGGGGIPPGSSRMSSPRRRGSPFVFRAPSLAGAQSPHPQRPACPAHPLKCWQKCAFFPKRHVLTAEKSIFPIDIGCCWHECAGGGRLDF